jgi:hypothetical protein
MNSLLYRPRLTLCHLLLTAVAPDDINRELDRQGL